MAGCRSKGNLGNLVASKGNSKTPLKEDDDNDDNDDDKREPSPSI